MGRNRHFQGKSKGNGNPMTCRLLRRYGPRACSGCLESEECASRGMAEASEHEAGRLRNDQDAHGRHQRRDVADGAL